MELIPTSGFKMDREEMELLSLLESTTNVFAKDCIIDKKRESVIFVVEKNNLGRVIGKGGETIKRLRTHLKRNVEVVGYDSDFEEFVKALFYQCKIVEIKQKNSRTSDKINLDILVAKNDVGRAIGKGGHNLERARTVLSRHYNNIDRIRISPFEAPPERKWEDSTEDKNETVREVEENQTEEKNEGSDENIETEPTVEQENNIE